LDRLGRLGRLGHLNCFGKNLKYLSFIAQPMGLKEFFSLIFEKSSYLQKIARIKFTDFSQMEQELNMYRTYR
jgi:hypothetical protein